MDLFLIISIVLATAYSASISEKRYKDYRVYDVSGVPDKIEQFKEYLKNSEIFAGASRDGSIITQEESPFLVVMVAPDLVEEFMDATIERRLKCVLIYEDFSELIRQEKTNPGRTKYFSWNAYYDVDDIYNYLKNMSNTYPDMARLVVGGKSYEGRDILGLRINSPQNQKISKPAMFIESGIHAREWIAPATTTYFINQLLTSSDPNITAMRDNFDWHIFPTVNPDGYHYTFTKDRMWRKTRSKSSNGCYGADPNRNWDHNWNTASSSSDPCDYQLYAGSRPFSEVETKTLSEYVTNIENLLGYIGFHADAQMLLVPYSDLKEHLDNYDDLIQIGKASLEYGKRVNGADYKGPGTAAEILYPASGGSMDWVREALGTQLVYTYELRGYYFHWPPWRISEQGDEYTQMMLGLATEAGKLGYY